MSWGSREPTGFPGEHPVSFPPPSDRVKDRGVAWMEIKFVVPDTEGQKILEFARDNLDFKQMDEDWCVEKRVEDNATIDYSPAPEPPNRKEGW